MYTIKGKQPRKPSKQTIVIIDEIRILDNLNRGEKELLALISQLDNKLNCFALNSYFSNILKVCNRQVQKMLAKLEKLGYISRDFIKKYLRSIKSMFACFYRQKVHTPHELNDTHKEKVSSFSTMLSKEDKKKEDKKKNLTNYLETEIAEDQKEQYKKFIKKRSDYNEANSNNLFYHKGWVKWFKKSLDYAQKKLNKVIKTQKTDLRMDQEDNETIEEYNSKCDQRESVGDVIIDRRYVNKNNNINTSGISDIIQFYKSKLFSNQQNRVCQQ